MSKELAEKIVTALVAAKTILLREGEREFAEIKKSHKKEIFDAVINGIGEDYFEIDGDGEGAYMFLEYHDYFDFDGKLIFNSHAEMFSTEEIRENLECFYADDESPGETLENIENAIKLLSSRSSCEDKAIIDTQGVPVMDGDVVSVMFKNDALNDPDRNLIAMVGFVKIMPNGKVYFTEHNNPSLEFRIDESEGQLHVVHVYVLGTRVGRFDSK